METKDHLDYRSRNDRQVETCLTYGCLSLFLLLYATIEATQGNFWGFVIWCLVHAVFWLRWELADTIVAWWLSPTRDYVCEDGK